ncbi:MAG TPA: sel1 repeat family protein, partial [Beijerinckiaceae bacterium]|nr:sel1 repeat family protein [Beijerinckiaceae bacterium]
MRISSALSSALALGALVIGAGPGFALEPPVRPRVPAANYASAGEAMRSAARDLDSGDTVGAVQALEFAAKKGNPLAQWKLGRMYASGDGVPLDDL